VVTYLLRYLSICKIPFYIESSLVNVLISMFKATSHRLYVTCFCQIIAFACIDRQCLRDYMILCFMANLAFMSEMDAFARVSMETRCPRDKRAWALHSYNAVLLQRSSSYLRKSYRFLD